MNREENFPLSESWKPLIRAMNVKYHVWNSQVPNPSSEKLLELFDNNDFQLLALQYPTQYTQQGNGDVLDVVLHKNVRLSDVIASNILD
jgi:hypothetical protein